MKSSKLLVVVLFLVSTCLAADEQPQWAAGALPMSTRITFAAAFPVIKGQPYTAQVIWQRTSRLPDGRMHLTESHNIHRRDSDGRLSDEQLASPHVMQNGSETFTLHGFVVIDPANMLSMQWNDESKTVLVSSIPAVYQSMKTSEEQCANAVQHAQSGQQDLGERTIQGIRAHGCRTTVVRGGAHPLTVVTEAWHSQMLGIDLLRLERLSDGSESRMEVTGLVLGEPDRASFEPPQEYKKVGRNLPH